MSTLLKRSKQSCLQAATQKYSKEKVLWKYAANLQENTHAKVWFK